MVFEIFLLFGRELDMNWETFLSEQPSVTLFSQSLEVILNDHGPTILSFLHDHNLTFLHFRISPCTISSVDMV